MYLVAQHISNQIARLNPKMPNQFKVWEQANITVIREKGNR